MQPVPAGTPRGTFTPDAPQPQPSKPKRSDYSRTTFFEAGRSLPQMLRESDTDVEVIVSSSAHNLTDDGDAVKQLEGVTRAAPAVVLLQATDIQGELSVDGQEIRSVLAGTLTEILKNRTKLELKVGGPFSMTYVGGEVVVSGKRLAYREDWKALPNRNRTYLVFLAQSLSTGELNPNTFDRMFEIDGDQIRRMTQDAEWGMGSAISASVALNVVRAAAGLPSPQ